MVEVDSAIKLIEESLTRAKTELAKVKEGNKAAKTRLRKEMMTIKNAAHTVRQNLTGE